MELISITLGRRANTLPIVSASWDCDHLTITDPDPERWCDQPKTESGRPEFKPKSACYTWTFPTTLLCRCQKQRFYVLLLTPKWFLQWLIYFSTYREGLQGHRRKWLLVLLHGFSLFLPSPGWESCVKHRHPSLLCSLVSFSKAQN